MPPVTKEFIAKLQITTIWLVCNSSNFNSPSPTHLFLHSAGLQLQQFFWSHLQSMLHFPRRKPLPAKASKTVWLYYAFFWNIMNMIFVLYLFTTVLFLWSEKLEVMATDHIPFDPLYCSSYANYWNTLLFYLYVLFKINQRYLFNLSSQKRIRVLSHSNLLNSLFYSAISFQRWNI